MIFWLFPLKGMARLFSHKTQNPKGNALFSLKGSAKCHPSNYLDPPLPLLRNNYLPLKLHHTSVSGWTYLVTNPAVSIGRKTRPLKRVQLHGSKDS